MRMAYRASTGDLGRSDRWNRDRLQYERDCDRYGDERTRFEEETDQVYRRSPPPPSPRFREDSRPRRPAPYDDYVVRDKRYYEDDQPRYVRRGFSPPPPPRREDYDRRVVIEKERFRSPSPPPGPRRPGQPLRRQSSLDTFDHRLGGFHEQERYGSPARRHEDNRLPTYVDIPLPRTRATLPAPPGPPRRHRHEHYDEIRVSDPDYYGDEEFRPYPMKGERVVREKEVIRTTRRGSRSRSRSRHSRRNSWSSSRSSSLTSRTSSHTTTTIKSEYPKKGKTRIPSKLVSKRAIIDLGYPYEEEGSTIIIQKALGPENIDDLLKLSEDYKKSELEVIAARSEAGQIVEERREEIVFAPPAPAAVPVPAPPPPPPPAKTAVTTDPPPVIYNAGPPPAAVAVPEVANTTAVVVRDPSPACSYTTTTSSATSTTCSTAATRAPLIVQTTAGPVAYREMSDDIPVGPLALADSHYHRHRSRSRGGKEIRAEIRELERELELRREMRRGGDIVRAERLSDGQLVLYEETVEKVEEPRRGVRIEKDRKGPPPKLLKAMLATLT